MFHNLGVEWAGSLIAFLGVAFMPIPFLFYIYGERLRKLSSYAPTDLGKKNDDEENRDGSDGNAEKGEEETGSGNADGDANGSSTGVDER